MVDPRGETSKEYGEGKCIGEEENEVKVLWRRKK